jgi:rhodanese-related sulfurtransferase
MHSHSGIALTLAVVLAACQKAPKETRDIGPAAATEVAIHEVSVADVATFVKTKAATIVDANNAETRQEQGVVPGAVLLTSSREYSLNELPNAKDTKLVFYCGGTKCRASDSAAKRAAEAGYADVSVMRDGIRGWKSAGQTTETPRS